jgi:hypothetical protein
MMINDSCLVLGLTDRYQEGARLLTHVDREETHAVSVIINLEQVREGGREGVMGGGTDEMRWKDTSPFLYLI